MVGRSSRMYRQEMTSRMGRLLRIGRRKRIWDYCGRSRMCASRWMWHRECIEGMYKEKEKDNDPIDKCPTSRRHVAVSPRRCGHAIVAHNCEPVRARPNNSSNTLIQKLLDLLDEKMKNEWAYCHVLSVTVSSSLTVDMQSIPWMSWDAL